MSDRPPNAIVKVVVRQAPSRKGWLWEQRAVRGGNVQAISPKYYDTKALAKRAGQRQVDLLNYEITADGDAALMAEHSMLLAYLEVRA
jgi:hypothetical protein